MEGDLAGLIFTFPKFFVIETLAKKSIFFALKRNTEKHVNGFYL